MARIDIYTYDVNGRVVAHSGFNAQYTDPVQAIADGDPHWNTVQAGAKEVWMDVYVNNRLEAGCDL